VSASTSHVRPIFTIFQPSPTLTRSVDFCAGWKLAFTQPPELPKPMIG
jgi:hypothetical protein